MSDIQINAPVTIPAPLQITAPVTVFGGGGGSSTFAELTDKATADIPEINNPLKAALAALVAAVGQKAAQSALDALALVVAGKATGTGTATGTNTGDQDLSGLMPKSGGTFTGNVSLSGQTLNLDGGTLSGGSIGFDFSGATSANLFAAIFQTATTLTMGVGMGNALWSAMGGGGTVASPSVTNLTVSGASTYGAGATFAYNSAAVTAQRNALGLGVGDSVTFSGISLGAVASSSPLFWFQGGSSPADRVFYIKKGTAISNSSGFSLLNGLPLNLTPSTAIADGVSLVAISAGTIGIATSSGPFAGSAKMTNLEAVGSATVGSLTLGSKTVGTLPAASISARARIEVTDASSPTVGSAVVGGGSVTCTVRSDGTTWKVTEIL